MNILLACSGMPLYGLRDAGALRVVSACLPVRLSACPRESARDVTPQLR